MYVSAGDSQWYRITFALSSDNTKEAYKIDLLKTTAQQGAQEQALIEKVKNSVVYISHEPTLDELGRVENVETPQSRPLSDPIKTDFDNADFTGGDMQYYKNNLYIAAPADGVTLIRNIAKGFWEAPQVLPCRRFSVIESSLYCHSGLVKETYKLFDGTNDNGNSINGVAAFPYQSFGDRTKLKNFDEFYSEGYITQNSKLTLTLKFDYLGATQKLEQEIDGGDEDIVFTSDSDDSLGTSPLGTRSLGGEGESNKSKFRVIGTFPKNDFFEMQPVYSSNATDYSWEITAFGPNARLSSAGPVSIKQ